MVETAQGTIEYLVIIAIIILIGLIVVSLSSNIFDSQQITRNIGSIEQTTAHGIKVIEIISDNENKNYLNLKNNSSDLVFIKKIKNEDNEKEFDDTVWMPNSNNVLMIGDICECEPNQQTKTCEIEIFFETKHGLEKKISQTKTIDCVNTVEVDNVICYTLWEPVCGVDGNTYPNDCVAEKIKKVEIAYWGECDEEEIPNDPEFNCAETEENVYFEEVSWMGPTMCCSEEDGVKLSVFPNELGCLTSPNGIRGVCVTGWDNHCGNGICEESLGENPCNCEIDCCANTNTQVYVSPILGAYTCCNLNDGTKLDKYFNKGNCIDPSEEVKGVCIAGWDNHCGNGICEESLNEDPCNCEIDCN